MDVWLKSSGKLVSNWYKTRVCVNACVRLCDDKLKAANNAINFWKFTYTNNKQHVQTYQLVVVKEII